MSHNPGFVAGSNIACSVPVAISGEWQVTQATYGEFCIGISSEAQRDAPVPNALTWAAQAGNPIRVYQEDEVCKALVGITAVTAGDPCFADGVGISPAPTAGGTGGTLPIVCIAIDSGAPGTLIDVRVHIERGI